jgi:hypothetical protein
MAKALPALWKRLAAIWAKKPDARPDPVAARAAEALAVRLLPLVPREYLSLHKYLDERFADTVVLTFAQIEDLLGFPLPDRARVQAEWWADADAHSAPSALSRSWLLAGRTASPNLAARTVAFERAAA